MTSNVFRPFLIYLTTISDNFYSTICLEKKNSVCCFYQPLWFCCSSYSKNTMTSFEYSKASRCAVFGSRKNPQLKTVYLQGSWPKSAYLKCFGIQLKTVYLQGPHSSRPCISRPCCILILGQRFGFLGPRQLVKVQRIYLTQYEFLSRSGSVKKFEFLRPFSKATEKTEKIVFYFVSSLY
jgi:hypothetical protein